MKHRVTANLVISKLPLGKFLDIEFFEDPNFKYDSTPQLEIANNKKCEALYRHNTYDLEIKSPYYMRTEIETDDETLIGGLAREKFNKVINNLSFLLNEFWGEYRIVKIDTWVKDKWQTVWSIFSNPTRLPISVNPCTLKAKEVEKLERLVSIDDEIYRKSLHYLGEGEKKLNRDLTKGEDRVDVETFLNLFKPIELISNKLGKAPPLPNKIKQAASLLGLKQEDIDEAIEFNRVRSQYDVAHAHKSHIDQKINYADLSSLSRRFIIKYLELKNVL